MSEQAIDWSALQVGDPDPEPQAIGLACGSFVLSQAFGLSFDCTRGPHDDPYHVSTGWAPPMTPDDAIVLATWRDGPEGSTTRVESISRARWVGACLAVARRNR